MTDSAYPWDFDARTFCVEHHKEKNAGCSRLAGDRRGEKILVFLYQEPRKGLRLVRIIVLSVVKDAIFSYGRSLLVPIYR